MPDLVALELHDVHIVGLCALAGWRTGTALSSMGTGKYAKGAYAVSSTVDRERLHFIAAVRDERE